MTNPAPDFDLRVKQYVILRDKIKDIRDGHKEQLAPLVKLLDDLNGWLLNEMNKLNVESIRTSHGTAYCKTRKSASIADGEAFWTFVVANQLWDLLDKKANVKAVEDYINQNNTAPPGIDFTSMMDVGVLRKDT